VTTFIGRSHVPNSTDRLRIGVIGCGQWGPNHIRVFSELDRSLVVACADTRADRLGRVQRRFPKLRTYSTHRELLDDPEIDAVVIGTPTGTHAALTHEALDAGKHVLVEKPLCRTSAEALELTRQAESAGLVLMVGHVFLFNDGIARLREAITSGELGRIHYLDAVRTNLGPIRGDVNALYDLATHDISIFNHLLGASPVAVSAVGRCITQRTIEDVSFATLSYPNGTLGHIHVSWLNPHKTRTITVVGERKMAHWDDIDPSDALRIYDKGVQESPHYDSFGEFQYLLRNADVHLPAIRRTEPLTNQAQAFLDWVIGGKRCASDARCGLEVVKVLEAAMRSIKAGGASSPVETGECASQGASAQPAGEDSIRNELCTAGQI
jgi:predicted dehydrogenase